jgi:hypothetical protein
MNATRKNLQTAYIAVRVEHASIREICDEYELDQTISRTAAKRQAHSESHMYRQGSAWIVSTWSDAYQCNELARELPWPVARQRLADWRRDRALALQGLA